MIDFDLFGSGNANSSILEPRKIFTTLNREPKFKRPSDEQAEVLDQWFERRESDDLTVKMNTGSGKTLVGLLALKSSLNEGHGPAIYVTPDKYLTTQVISEANTLGITVTDSENDMSFIRGESILVTNIRKIVNSKSVFGVKEVKIPIGSLVIDDAHACLDNVEEQFVITAKSENRIYKDILNCLSTSIQEYNQIEYMRVFRGDPDALFEVPYWIWKGKVSEVATILFNNKNEDELRFKFELVIDVLDLCQCVFSGTKIEIAPRCVPIDLIPSLSGASRKIYMTATLANDGILVSHFKANIAAIAKPIKPKGAGDMGDRMIIAPQELKRDATLNELQALCHKVAANRNVVVIVPSGRQSERWRSIATLILDKDTISNGVERLKSSHVGLVVLVNKYDGIDLPGSACELLILDDIPSYSGLINRKNSSILEGTQSSNVEIVQKIEQGMGRGVRSSEDKCVVIIWGSRLTKIVNFHSTYRFFTEITKAQFGVARTLAKQIQIKSLDDLIGVMNYSFSRNPDWIRVSKEAIVKAPDTEYFYIDEYVENQRKAFDAARIKQFDKSISYMQLAVNQASDDRTKGYLKQQLAEYMWHKDVIESQKMLISAVTLNNQVMKPMAGVEYRRINTPENQFQSAEKYISRFQDGNELILWMNALLDDLEWEPLATKRFENAIYDLGSFLGFSSQRPEVETNKGPDNLWGVTTHTYFVIECKSGSTITETVSKHDCNQLLGSVSWFNQNYPPANSAVPIMIHPKHKFSAESSPTADFKIIDEERMGRLRDVLRKSSVSLSTNGAYKDRDKIREIFTSANLVPKKFEEAFTRSHTK